MPVLLCRFRLGGGMMADITNKNELKRRIELFLDELDYSINEDFCKETMKMMREFIGHASHRLDCEDSRVKSLKKKLKDYKDLEKQGLLLRLPCSIGTTVYNITAWDAVTEKREIDGKNFYRIVHKYKVSKSTFSLGDFYNFGETVFLTKAEAEQKLKEMESD